jgi:tetratricopeptide (TPR) repeat protein
MSTQMTIDDRTAEVIRSALIAAQTGRIKEACEIGERGLADGCDPAALHAMIGSFLCQTNDFESALPHLQAAHEARSADSLIANNLASALAGCERYDEAFAVLTDQIVTTDASGGLRRLRGYVAQMAGNFGAAAADYEGVLQDYPTDWETWNNLGNTKICSDDLPGGITALRRAAELNPRVPQTRFNLALALRDAGEFAEAENELRLIAEDFPHDPTPLGYVFGLLQMQGFDAEARKALEQAIERDPQNVGMLIALGREQLLGFEIPEAIRTFRGVLELEPTNGDAFLGIADALEHERPEGLPELLVEAEAANIDPVRLDLIRALIARREKRYREGAEALKDIPPDFDPIRRWHLEGQLLDGLGDYDGAFAAYSRMNEVLASEPTEPLRRAAELRGRIRDRLERTTVEWLTSWAAPSIVSDRAPPVFLVGFPRSGTTLLDTMLMGHPEVEVMEERPVIAQIRADTGFDAIAGMGESDVRRLQERYFDLAGKYTALREGSLLIDKSPLHMLSVALIYRLFPNAHFILALRHPADVVLSCFMAKFRMNASMANFTDLPTIAEFYDLSFSMWEKARSLFPVPVHTVVYEKMIEDPEAVLRPIVEGLDLKWHPDVLDHQRTAKERGVITTASYAQVTEPLYRKAAGRWHHYRKHLEPILPTLRPWIEKFGYEL